jgi:hypothetical protein
VRVAAPPTARTRHPAATPAWPACPSDATATTNGLDSGPPLPPPRPALSALSNVKPSDSVALNGTST